MSYNLNRVLFQCEESKSEIVFNSFQTIFLPSYNELNTASEIYIGKHIYQKHIIIEEIEVVMRIVRTEWCHLQNMMLYNNTLSFAEMLSSRELINKTLNALVDSLQMCDCFSQKERYITKLNKALSAFSSSVIPLRNLDDSVLLKISLSSMNNTKCPVYQFFHTYLDIQYYLMVLNYICGVSYETCYNRISNIMRDLIIVSKRSFKRQNINSQHVFQCNCLRNFWIILQLFIEKCNDDKDAFWKVFNELLDNEEPTFLLWLLRDIASLHSFNSLLTDEGNNSDRINPNYIFLERKLKVLLLNAGSESVAECFKIIEPLLCNLWIKKARIEVYQIIWEYYSKRLNISTKKMPSTALEFNELVETVLWSPKDCAEDFELFVGFLICHLREYPMHWGKIKGRIFSELSPNKVKELNEIGIMHVMLLFLCLSNVNFSELSKKIISFLECLPRERRLTTPVWNTYTLFIFKHVREGHDLENAARLMIEMLQAAACDQKSFYLIKEFVVNFEHVINFSINMQLHQWVFINTWLAKYLATCYFTDLKVTLNVLLSTLDKVSNADSWPVWEAVFKEHIYASLKQISNSPAAPDVIGKIAGKLCLLIPNLSADAFNFFSSEIILPNISCQFLCIVLNNYPNSFILSPQQESVVMQSWFKVSLLTVISHEELTKNVLKLDCFPAMLKAHMHRSKDPIYALIEYLSSDIRQHIQSSSMIKLCELSFGQADKWISQYLIRPDNEAVVFRIYTCMSLAFMHCGPLLYDSNKSSSPLTRLVQALLLPTDFLIGKPLHAFVLSAVNKTWQHFFEAIVKLNTASDTFLERTLRDMIVKYMQYFSTTDSPVVKALEKEETAPVVLDKICNIYFKHPTKESHANILKALKIISDSVQSTTYLPLMKLIVNKTLAGLFEVVIFHAQRNAAINVIKVITSSPLYPQVVEDFSNSVMAVTESRLAFNSTNYFQLMYILAKFIPADIKNLLGNIKQQVCNVERMRGVGFDKSLRMLFEKLETAVEGSK